MSHWLELGHIPTPRPITDKGEHGCRADLDQP